MNAFGGGATQFAETVNASLAEMGATRKNAQENGTAKPTGPPKEAANYEDGTEQYSADDALSDDEWDRKYRLRLPTIEDIENNSVDKTTGNGENGNTDTYVRGEHNDDRGVREGAAEITGSRAYHGGTAAEGSGPAQETQRWDNYPKEIRSEVLGVVTDWVNSTSNADDLYAYILTFANLDDATITFDQYENAVRLLTEQLFDDAVNLHPVLFENRWKIMGGSISQLRKNILNAVDPEVRYSVEDDALRDEEWDRKYRLSLPTLEEENAQKQKNTTQKGGVQKAISSQMTQADIQAVQSIGRKSMNQFTASNIQATKRFARQYWKEMGIKSPFFRAWFGDWRSNDQTKVQIADRRGDTRGVQRNTDTGWDIQVSGMVFNETVRHTESYNVAARPYLPYINDIVQKAVLFDSFGIDPNKPKSGNSLLMHSMYAVADIGKGPEILKLYVEEMNDPNADNTSKRAYQLQNVGKYQPQNGSSQNSVSSISSAAGNIHTVADLFATVKQKDSSFQPKPASEVVNDDGTPMVVYHGTGDNFTEFKHSEISNREGSFFFAQNREDAEGYTGNGKVMEVYVNLQNPIDYNDMPRYVYQLPDKRAQVEELRRLGYDGWMCDMDTGWGEISAFYANQIKSATDNIGTFDGNNPDIRYSVEDIADDENANVDYEELESQYTAENRTHKAEWFTEKLGEEGYQKYREYEKNRDEQKKQQAREKQKQQSREKTARIAAGL